MSDSGDLYGVLGVDPLASIEEVRSAYRKIALECHPDRTQDPVATERFRVVTQAYEVLADEEARAEYDRMIGCGSPQAPAGVGDLREMVDAVGVVVGSVMGAVRARRSGKKLPNGACLACQGDGELVVDLAIVAFARTCPVCNGSGKSTAESASPEPEKTS